MMLFNGERLWAPNVMYSDNTTVMLFRSTLDSTEPFMLPKTASSDYMYGQQSICQNLDNFFKEIEKDDMSTYFISWPNNVIEEWANENNDSFTIKFNMFYAVESIELKIHIKIFGNTSKDWIEYNDSYQQAITMMKLESDL